MHKIALAAAAAALAACSPSVPDSGQGVGFGDYSEYTSYRAAREAELAGARQQALVPGARISNESPTQPPQAARPAPPPAAAVQPAAVPARPVEPAPVITAQPLDPTPAPTPAPPPAQPPRTAAANNPAISDEQDFAAVSGRETIESDRERLRAQRQAYQVIAPTALPSRSGRSGPNIVQFALSTTNRVGQRVYRRSALFAENRYRRNCAKYASDDLAQEAFLGAGGPERDKMGLDPDGDGFACDWDPTPFRRATAGRG